MNDNIINGVANIVEATKAQNECSIIELGESNILAQELEDNNNEWLQSYIEGKVDELTADQMRRIIAKAVIVSVKNNTMEVPAEAESIASLVDEGLTKMKVAYQVENDGEYDLADAFKEMVDHQISRIATIADHAITKAEKIALEKSDKVTDTVIDFAAKGLKAVACAFPPARPLAKFIEAGAQYIKPIARKAVKKGIQVLANTAKTFVKKAVPIVKKAVSFVGRKVKGFLSRVIGF